jgi:hypothetical protein
LFRKREEAKKKKKKRKKIRQSFNNKIRHRGQNVALNPLESGLEKSKITKTEHEKKESKLIGQNSRNWLIQ